MGEGRSGGHAKGASVGLEGECLPQQWQGRGALENQIAVQYLHMSTVADK